MTLLIITIGYFLITALNSYRNKEIKLNSKLFHLIGIILVATSCGLFLNDFIYTLFSGQNKLFSEYFVDIGFFNKYVVLGAWITYVYLNFVIIIFNWGIAKLNNKAVKQFNKYIPFFIISDTFQTYLIMKKDEYETLFNGVSPILPVVVLLLSIILTYVIIYYLFNNKIVNKIYEEAR